MDNPSTNIKCKYCCIHNQPIITRDQNEISQCQVCMQEEYKPIIQQQYQEKIINNNKQFDLQLEQLSALKGGILKYKESIIASLDKSIQQISEQIKIIESQKQSIQQMDMIMNQYRSIEDFTSYLKNNQKSNGQCQKQIVVNLLLDLKQNIRHIGFLGCLGVILNQRKQEVIPEKQEFNYKTEYELTQQVKSPDSITALAVHQKTNTLIVGMLHGNILIHDFKYGEVGVERQRLKHHFDEVLCLYCMKNTHSFVSGGSGSEIIIWSFEIMKWQEKKTLNTYRRDVKCIIMNSKEDLLISGNQDKAIIFWEKKDYRSWSLPEVVDVDGIVVALSLNENEDKLIASTEYSNKILIMTIQKNEKWKLIQTIEHKNGYRLCFTIQDQFVFQPTYTDYLEVYDYDETKQQFYEKTKVKVQSVESCYQSFPCHFIKNLNILTVKHGQFVNIFNVNKCGEYQLIQSINFRNDELLGKMTDDGKYLITWDEWSKDLQVREERIKQKSS